MLASIDMFVMIILVPFTRLIDKELNTNLEVQCSLVCEISLVPSQSYYNIWTGLSLKLFNPVLCPYKWLLANKTGRGGFVTQLVKITIHVMERWGQQELSYNVWLCFWSIPQIDTLKKMLLMRYETNENVLRYSKSSILCSMGGWIILYCYAEDMQCTQDRKFKMWATCLFFKIWREGTLCLRPQKVLKTFLCATQNKLAAGFVTDSNFDIKRSSSYFCDFQVQFTNRI